MSTVPGFEKISRIGISCKLSIYPDHATSVVTFNLDLDSLQLRRLITTVMGASLVGEERNVKTGLVELEQALGAIRRAHGSQGSKSKMDALCDLFCMVSKRSLQWSPSWSAFSPPTRLSILDRDSESSAFHSRQS